MEVALYHCVIRSAEPVVTFAGVLLATAVDVNATFGSSTNVVAIVVAGVVVIMSHRRINDGRRDVRYDGCSQ